MFDLMPLAVVTATFLLAGAIKGIIGLGLPTVSLGLLAAVFDLTTAMALLIVPSLVTNLWQAAVGGYGRLLLARLWFFLLTAAIGIWIGAAALTRVDLALLTALLGGLLVAYSTISLAGIRLTVPPQREVWAGPLFGTANGVLTGMTGSFVVPGVMYLQALGLPRDAFVQAMGMLFTVSTAALALALHDNSILTSEFGLLSTAAVIPAAVGMATGQYIRRMLSERGFKRIFFSAIFLLGVYLIVSAGIGVR